MDTSTCWLFNQLSPDSDPETVKEALTCNIRSKVLDKIKFGPTSLLDIRQVVYDSCESLDDVMMLMHQVLLPGNPEDMELSDDGPIPSFQSFRYNKHLNPPG